jgi:nitroreductase
MPFHFLQEKWRSAAVYRLDGGLFPGYNKEKAPGFDPPGERRYPMEHIMELVRARRSVRSFDGQPLPPALREQMEGFLAQVPNPYDIPVRFCLLDAAERGLSSPVITGETLYLAARVPRVEHGEEAFGYSFETVVLFAQSLGLGTTWIGGTMNRGSFERAIGLKPEERMPCVSPLGRPAAKMSLREALMRKGAKADSREPFESRFFDGDFGKPLTEAAAGVLREPLEAVRLAPSAVNRQPWRVVVKDGAAHFYEKRTKGFSSDAAGDLQKVDLGIALCHFDLCARDLGQRPRFLLEDPGLPAPQDCVYLASFVLD